ncbi:glycoside hydrolase family 17 protein [Ancylobacter amanitiformis]|uniref:Endo-1,3-beta-glucanase btgC n=1 Tax=Ancylobacter amanitiformis TaxID=217069 RepID=A0ABU0LKJ0_9HYPH|nr:beta-1,6-glucan synthase [Ancylobacter amanitiformis]MDQ0509217.1 glucan 1,3-beta-glucosidase [Ancylobacter amanitiformis]
MRLPFALAAIVGVAIVAVWAWLGHPVPAPVSPLAAGEKLPCVSYAPFRPGQSPFNAGLVIPAWQIDDDFERLSKITQCVRTYSTEMGLHVVPELARKHGLTVLQGIWIGRDPANNRIEIDAAVKAAQENPDVIKAVIVGNEVLLRGEQSAVDLAALIKDVRAKVPASVQVTYADVWEFWERNRDLANSVDFVTVHILPFWEDLPVAAEKSVAHLDEIRQHVGKVFAGKDILIGETGWPSEGRMREGALPSPSNQANVIQQLLALAKEKNYRLNVIEAFDQPWKRASEGTVGGHWGFLDAYSRDFKFAWGQPVSDHPGWMWQALVGLAVAGGIFGAAALGRRRAGAAALETRHWLAVSGTAFFAGLMYGRLIATVSVESLGAGGWIRGIAMLVLALAVPLACAVAIGARARLVTLAAALNPALLTGWTVLERGVAFLLAASVVLAVQIAFGLVFDPRYKDFQFAGLTPIIAAFAFYAMVAPAREGVQGRQAEALAAAIFLGSGLYIALNETFANWQGLWTGALLVVLSLTLARLATAGRTR